MLHEHTEDCYLRDSVGLVYRPCRADGLDRNLTHLKRVDFEAGYGHKGLTLVCTKFDDAVALNID